MTSWVPATFTRVMTEHDDLIQRLHEQGEHPVPDGLRDGHVHAMRAAATSVAGGGAPHTRFGRLAVAGAAVVGFVAGSTGFAMAGALPDPAQGVAHDVLSVVQVDVPDRRGGPPDFILEDPCKGPPAWVVEGRAPNEGEQQAHEDFRASEACPEDDDAGRPEGAGPPEGVGRPDGVGGGRPEGAGPPAHVLEDDCTGPPPWAGTPGGPASGAERQAFEDRRAACEPADAEDTGG